MRVIHNNMVQRQYTYINIHIHIRIYIYIHTYVHIHMHKHMYTHMYTHIYMHTYIRWARANNATPTHEGFWGKTKKMRGPCPENGGGG